MHFWALCSLLFLAQWGSRIFQEGSLWFVFFFALSWGGCSILDNHLSDTGYSWLGTAEVQYKYHPILITLLIKRQNFEGCGPLRARRVSNFPISSIKIWFQKTHDKRFRWDYMIQMQRMGNPILGQLPALGILVALWRL